MDIFEFNLLLIFYILVLYIDKLSINYIDHLLKINL